MIKFEQDLKTLLERYGIDTLTRTPASTLARFLVQVMDAWNVSRQGRRK